MKTIAGQRYTRFDENRRAARSARSCLLMPAR